MQQIGFVSDDDVILASRMLSVCNNVNAGSLWGAAAIGVLDMKEFFSHPDAIMAIILFGVPAVAIIAGCWLKVRITQSNNDLKQSMLDRGMSAQEIEQVINSGTRHTWKYRRSNS